MFGLVRAIIRNPCQPAMIRFSVVFFSPVHLILLIDDTHAQGSFGDLLGTAAQNDVRIPWYLFLGRRGVKNPIRMRRTGFDVVGSNSELSCASNLFK